MLGVTSPVTLLLVTVTMRLASTDSCLYKTTQNVDDRCPRVVSFFMNCKYFNNILRPNNCSNSIYFPYLTIIIL